MNPSDTSLPESDPASPVTETASENAGDDLDGPVPDGHRDGLRRLARRVEQAVETIERLRAENERLRRRVEELEAGPDVPDGETLLTLEKDPEALRDKITHFIDAIDAYLDRPAAGPPDEETADDPPDA
jgi:FtsZ-binding cell division protein ZapB